MTRMLRKLVVNDVMEDNDSNNLGSVVWSSVGGVTMRRRKKKILTLCLTSNFNLYLLI